MVSSDGRVTTGQSEATFLASHPTVLVLSSSLFTDRMLAYTDFWQHMRRGATTFVWANSAKESARTSIWGETTLHVEPYPEVREFRLLPHTYLRRMNEFAWDFRLRPPSRLSHWTHVRSRKQSLRIRILRYLGRAIAELGLESTFERHIEKLLLRYPRSPEAERRLRSLRPDLVVATDPFWLYDPAVIACAKNLRIPVVGMVNSFDNITTKSRLLFQYDGYMVWSDQMMRELYQYYERSRTVRTAVVGAPQFDAFYQDRFGQSRREFCTSQKLDPQRRIVLYALGSPNILREIHAVMHLAEAIVRGDLGFSQLLVRPHPLFDRGEELARLQPFAPYVVVQKTGDAKSDLANRYQDSQRIVEWVNAFRHADVVVNFASTATIDAAICDRPVVNFDFDPEPGQPNRGLVGDINHLWPHFKPIAESGGVWLVNDLDELVGAVRHYLEHPGVHRDRRRWIAEYVCGYLDGRCGERMAEAILDFLKVRVPVKVPAA